MKQKLVKAIKNPKDTLAYARDKVSQKLAGKYFSYSSEYRSDSENGLYVSTVMRILKDQNTFENFKRLPEYNRILEHVSFEQGQAYLDILQKKDDGFLQRALETVLVRDDVGNPRKFSYDGMAMPLSTTTLRYVKVASDINQWFGDSFESIAEIGCGYGGQCYVNDQLLSVKKATLFDLPFVNELIQRYLETQLLRGAYCVQTPNQHVPMPFDLVISNYAFSEVPRPLQETYIEKVLRHAQKGYLTMNSGRGGERDHNKLSLDELKERLPEFEIIDEEPLTAPHNYIILWGHK